MGTISDTDTIRALLERRCRRTPDQTYLVFRGEPLTYRGLARAVDVLANGLNTAVDTARRVAVMLPNHPDAVLTFFALAKLGVTQIPVNVNLRGQTLAFLIEHGDPGTLIADRAYADTLQPILARRPAMKVLWRSEGPGSSDFQGLLQGADTAPPPGEPTPDSVISILYTSGTTGPPKGVLVTDRMHRTCAYGSAVVADVRPGDVLYLWEPIYHVTGTEVLLAGLEHEISIALTERFSASRFWEEVKTQKATHVHYVGGILQILLKAPLREDDGDNPVRIAWGGGAPAQLWEPFEQRFGVQIRENYGMTETSSLTTFNLEGRRGSVGKPAPYFDVVICADDGTVLPPGAHGEIRVREKEPGLVTSGYHDNPQATAHAFRDGWFCTGDLGCFDTDGFMYYAGRLKDSIRRRGENISAWEVERVVEQLDLVEECAVVGVPGELDDEEIKLFVKLVDGTQPDPDSVFRWCRAQLAPFQVPRYLDFVGGFEKTDTQRIRKETLPRGTEASWRHDPSGTLTPPPAHHAC